MIYFDDESKTESNQRQHVFLEIDEIDESINR